MYRESRYTSVPASASAVTPREQGIMPALPQLGISQKPRKSKNQKNMLMPSPFHPHVLAAERVFKWHTPYSIQCQTHLETVFPQTHLNKLQHVLGEAVMPKTREGWGAGLLRFNQYCDSISLPEEGQMPASELLLALFVANCAAGKVSSSTVDKWLAGIHRGHQVADALWFSSHLLSQVKKGATKLAPSDSRHPKRCPITLEHLDALRRHLDLTNSFDATVYAVACVAFWACCRLGELLVTSRGAFNLQRDISRGCLKTRGVAKFGRRFTMLHLPKTKTKGQQGEDIYLIDCPLLSNPVNAFEHHLASNPHVPEDAPLFAWQSADGGWCPMTKTWFMESCIGAWRKEGLDLLEGHSFRIGGMTHHLMSGVDPWVVMVIGRWSSSSFLMYWRKVEEILPNFISEAYDAVESLTTHMSRFVQNMALR